MLTEQALRRLTDLIDREGGTHKQEMKTALEDLQKAIAGQALLIRNMGIELRNHQVDEMAMDQILSRATLAQFFQSIGSPKRNPFTVKDADHTAQELVDKVAQANDFAQILSTVVKVATVFI